MKPLDEQARDTARQAADCLKRGGVIALPTDTVYGIAAALRDEQAIRRIFTIKHRPIDRPLPVLLSSISALSDLAGPISAPISRLLSHFWPGPLTVVLRCNATLPVGVLAADGTIGVRIPDHPLAIDVISQSGGAIACTSANRSGDPPATNAIDVANALGSDLDFIVNGGETPGGVPSTVIALDRTGLQILREGAISENELRRILDYTCDNDR